MRQWLGLAGGWWASPGDGAAASTCRQQQAGEPEVGPVGSASLNPMASTLLEGYLIFGCMGEVW